MFSFRRFMAVAKKEFLELRRNALFFTMTIAGPIIFFFLFAYGFPLDAKNIPMAVVDRDMTAASRSLIDAFERSADLFDLRFVTGDEKRAEREIAKGDVRLVLTIPDGFERKIQAGLPADVQALIDGAYPNTASLVGANAEAVVSAFGFEVLTKYLLLRPELESAGYTFTPIDLSPSAWYNPSFRSEDFIVPAILALVMVFLPPMVATISLAREKESGSILNMYCSSLGRTEYLLGKMAPYVVISFANLLLFILLSVVLFDVPMRGSFALLAFAGFVYTATVLAVGLLVAVLVKSQVAAILITFVGTVMPAFLFSGFMVPVSSLDQNGQMTAKGIPATYFIDLTRKVMVKGAGAGQVFLEALIIVGMCLVLYILSIALFKKRVG